MNVYCPSRFAYCSLENFFYHVSIYEISDCLTPTVLSDESLSPLSFHIQPTYNPPPAAFEPTPGLTYY